MEQYISGDTLLLTVSQDLVSAFYMPSAVRPAGQNTVMNDVTLGSAICKETFFA